MPTGPDVAAVLVGVLAGGAAGTGIRLLLGRLRRGVVVRRGVLEASTAAVTGLGVALSWPAPTLPLVVWIGWLGVTLSAVDLVHHRLPDAVTLPAVPITATLLMVIELGSPTAGSLFVAAAVAGVLTLVFWLSAVAAPRAIGLGDVKLMASLGLATGYVSVASALLAVTLAFVLGAAVAAAGLISRRLTMTSAIPFGPCLLAGAWLVTAVPAVVSAVL
ncbi:prepilin peptidase [Nakamurella sp. GG22]